MRCALLLVALQFCVTSSVRAADWLQWRGPSGLNLAADDASAPVKWSENENLAWVTPVPGRGHCSPIVVGNRIYVTTADEKNDTQSLLIYDRQTGKQLHESVAHRGGLNARLHPHNTHASSTAASDGQRVYALFHNNGDAWVTAFDLEGQQLWQQRAIEFQPRQFEFGFGSSPVLVDGLVIVASEYDGGESGVVALDAASGDVRWKIERPQSLSYSSPARATLNGQPVLLLCGNQSVSAYEPGNGQQLWSTPGTTRATCGTMVWSESLGLAFASGGFPDSFTLAVKTDGDHSVVWENNRIKCYEQSLLLSENRLYAVADSGVVYCLDAATGEEHWKQRLGGNYSSSPVLIDGKIYVSNERGTTYVFADSAAGFQSLGENQLGNECFATPTPVGNRLYHRYASGSGDERQEYLAAIGE